MINVLKWLLIISGVAATVAFLKKQYDLVNQYVISFNYVKVKSLSLDSVSLIVGLKIENPSNIEALLTHINTDIYMNGVLVGNASSDVEQVIPAKGYNIIAVDVFVANKSFFSGLITVIGNINKMVEVHYVGTVAIKEGWISVTVPVDDTEKININEML